jgi:hypothetical protein
MLLSQGVEMCSQCATLLAWHDPQSILAGASEYFRKRLEDWDNDTWTMMGSDGKPVLVVGMEQHQHEAAAAVVRLMYEEVVPDGTPVLQLARVGDFIQRC